MSLVFINLDMRQEELKGFSRVIQLTYFYFTELMGLVFAISPKELGLKHFVDPMPLLNSKGILTEQMQ